MKTFCLIREQLVPRPLVEVFAFFENPENLGTLTPPSMAMIILTPGPMVMKTGMVIDYAVRIVGLRHRWTSLIAAYDPPHGFADVQLKGPYSFWHHTHLFRETDGGTLIRDEVRYILPFGIIGRWIGGPVVRRQLQRIFNYRAGVVRQLFGSPVP
jgi:ligand-binding SRPBCC domain-containing protein